MVRTGVILLNLGGPDSLEAVRPFLFNLFSDREIIPLGPPFMQRPLAWLISTLRAPGTRKAYALIGGASPILRITTAQADALEQALKKAGDFRVYVGMRYWHPFITDAVRRAREEGARRIVGLSLYPQYSKATTGSTKERFDEAVERYGLESRFIGSWYDHPLYIDALADVVKKGLGGFRAEVLLFSAHSLPMRFVEEGDPYVREVEGTVRALLERLGEAPPHRLCYQSRSGPVRWLGPSTDEVIVELGRKGVRRVMIVPVSFVSDHIETLYEIDILYRELAEREGMELRRVEALNTHPLFIAALRDLVLRAGVTSSSPSPPS